MSNPIRVRLRAKTPRVKVVGGRAKVVLTLVDSPVKLTIVEAF